MDGNGVFLSRNDGYIADGNIFRYSKLHIPSNMPYLLISRTSSRMHGPTTVGDFKSDPQLMARLGATLTGVGVRELAEYETRLTPREVLNILEKEGWKLLHDASNWEGRGWLYRRDTCQRRCDLIFCDGKDEVSGEYFYTERFGIRNPSASFPDQS
ncbi:unnamed protein product [Heligmosomoides polygyrus]|uniref:GTP cyclohydrolase 1 feedback regulatory protein n=1 Tax=Heligmosomoides polygyrus TaxID=6339 RepID=A0A3P7U535_HELPZ|nr:unnamed protein product [Heligmosomoides polygyrus]